MTKHHYIIIEEGQDPIIITDTEETIVGDKAHDTAKTRSKLGHSVVRIFSYAEKSARIIRIATYFDGRYQII